MLKKIITIIVIIVITVTIGILSITVLPWLTLFVGLQLQPEPPSPITTHGKFPFHLVYEIDGKQYTIDDIIICDYAGTDMNEARGKYIKWEQRLANENKITRFKFTEDYQYGIKLFDGVVQNQGSTVIICDVGNPQYYLGYKKYIDYNPGRIIILSSSVNGVINENELWNKYNIKIIEKKFSQPMVGNGITE